MGGVQRYEHDRRGADQPDHDRVGPGDQGREHERDQNEARKSQPEQRREAAPAGYHDHYCGEDQPNDQQRRTPLEV